MAYKVFEGLVTACLFADCPTRVSLSSVKATYDGVVLSPSLFSITLVLSPSMMETHELVVPKSIPIIATCYLRVINYKGNICTKRYFSSN